MPLPIAILHEHPDWFRPLFAELDRRGVPYERLDAATQVDVLEELGLLYPRTRVINAPSRAVEAARGLRFPVMVKANVGGSGAGIVRYDSQAALAGAAPAGRGGLGVDRTP